MRAQVATADKVSAEAAKTLESPVVIVTGASRGMVEKLHCHWERRGARLVVPLTAMPALFKGLSTDCRSCLTTR